MFEVLDKSLAYALIALIGLGWVYVAPSMEAKRRQEYEERYKDDPLTLRFY